MKLWDRLIPGSLISRLVPLLGVFGILISAAASAGTFGGTLSWNPPTINLDGSALTDLQGYRIYIGQASGSYSQTIDVDNPGVTDYTIDELDAGTYYFAVSAYDFNGNESAKSAEISVSLDDTGSAQVETSPAQIDTEASGSVTTGTVTSASGGSASSATGLFESVGLLLMLCIGVRRGRTSAFAR